jgi:hypothetical protein
VKSRAVFYFSIIGIISPLVSLLYGLKQENIDIKRWALIVFITFYGSTIFLSETNDGHAHLMNVYITYMNMDFFEFFSILIKILTFQRIEGTNGDLYIHILSFIVGPILRTPELFFVIVSFVYGYFYSSSVFLVGKYVTKSNRSKLLIIIFVFFILWKSIEGINTVRTWTGMWVLFYCVSHYFIYRKRKYLFLTFLPPLIHFSYFLLAIPAWIVLFFKWIPSRIFFLFYVLSMGFSFNTEKAVELAETTELGSSRRKYILDENNSKMIEKREGISDKRKEGNWYLRLNAVGFHRIGFIILVFAVFMLRLPSKYNSYEFNLLSIGMLNAAMANYLSFIFAVNSRSHIISEVFILSFLVIFLARRFYESDNTIAFKMFKQACFVSLIFFIPFIVYRLVDGIYYFSIFLVAFPFIPWFESSLNVSIREALLFLIS